MPPSWLGDDCRAGPTRGARDWPTPRRRVCTFAHSPTAASGAHRRPRRRSWGGTAAGVGAATNRACQGFCRRSYSDPFIVAEQGKVSDTGTSIFDALALRQGQLDRHLTAYGPTERAVTDVHSDGQTMARPLRPRTVGGNCAAASRAAVTCRTKLTMFPSFPG